MDRAPDLRSPARAIAGFLVPLLLFLAALAMYLADAICALKMSVGLILMNMNVDVTADGRVTYGDARQIMQRIP